ncbi:MAG: DUF4129 domain-containing transglutaminase family protein, partial [Nannocystaceae bacterium]
IRLQTRGLLERRYRPALGTGDKITINRKQPGPLRYKTVSRLRLPSDPELATVQVGSVSVSDEFYATPSNFTPQFTALAASLKAGRRNQIELVRAVLEHLSTLEYTLEQPQKPTSDPRDPLEYFLFNARAGHCEYFATAAAMLLREMKVPTRLVNGYVGGTLNEYGGFYAVTQADAHSWIEVYFEGFGWLRFDPTPTHGRRGQSSSVAFSKLREYLDALRNKYLAYVIDYNFRTQLDILSSIGFQWRDQQFKVNKERLTPLAASILGVLTLLLLVRIRRRSSRARAVTRSMNRVLQSFSVHGFDRHESETPQAFTQRVSAAKFPQARMLSEFVEEYERLRFSREERAASRPPASFIVTARQLRRAAKSWRRPR